MFIPITLFCASLFCAKTYAQFVPTPSNFTRKIGGAGVQVRFKEVPTGICEKTPGVLSLAGYADVAADAHLFWWFFEARDVDPTIAPLTIWINGGPGSTSMYGLFQENGPCGIDSDLNVTYNPYSWNNVSNMIYIDQPVPVGFSYSYVSPGYVEQLMGTTITLPNNTCPDYAEGTGTCGTYSAWNISTTVNSTQNAAPFLWKAVQGFVGAFPQYVNGGVNLWAASTSVSTGSLLSAKFHDHSATESYGGHYGPVFAKYIVDQTERGNGVPIPLKNVLIGNGWFDPILSYQAYYNYTVNPGNPYTGNSIYNASIQAMLFNSLYGKGNCLDQLRYCATTGDNGICMTADQFCANNVEFVYDNVLGLDEYDVREPDPDPFPPTFFIDYLNTQPVQDAVGAYQNFTDFSTLVGGDNAIVVGGSFGRTGDDGREVNSIEDISFLLQNNISVTTFFGDADYNCNMLGGYATMQLVNASGFSSAGFTNISVPELSVTQGVVKQSNLFSFLRIFWSGHEVPFYQGQLALAMFQRAINRVDIATGKLSLNTTYKTTGVMQWPYPFDEGNSTVQSSPVNVTDIYNTTTHLPSPQPPSINRRRRLLSSRWRRHHR